MAAVNHAQEEERSSKEDDAVKRYNLDEAHVFRNPSIMEIPYQMRRGKELTFSKHYVVGVNWSEEKIYFGAQDEPLSVSFSDIVQVEVFRDDQTITKTNRGSQIGGAAIGAVAFGGVGAIIGGLSGSSRSVERVKRIGLRIEVEHPDVLIFSAHFLKPFEDKGDKADSMTVKSAASAVEKWYSILTRAMRKSAQPQNAELSSTNNAEDRLAKLWSLKESGALTEEEYAEQKKKLLEAP